MLPTSLPSPPRTPPPPALPLRGACGYVLEAIALSIQDGQPAISYAVLSADTGYSIPTVQAAVRTLARDGYIRVRWGGPRRPNRYDLLSPDQRRTRAVARLLGVIQ